MAISAGSARRGAQVTWDAIRGSVIREACRDASGGSAVPTLALLRGDATVLSRLDGLISAAEAAGARASSSDLGARARLASLLDLRGRHEEAYALLEPSSEAEAAGGAFGASSSSGAGAAQVTSLPPAVLFLRELVRRHVTLAADRRRLLAGGGGDSGTSAGAAPLPVPVLDAASTTREEVAERFLVPGRPCVLRGASLVSGDWTPQGLAARLRQRRVPLRRCEGSSALWARLEFAGSEPFEDFVSRLEGKAQDSAAQGKGDSGGSPQLFDYSIWQSCADILGDEVRMPAWFPVDLYSYATARVHPVSGSASPTLFVAAEGTGSALHVDFLQTHFWMAMCHGRKRWRLLPREDLALLEPRYLVDLNPAFAFDLDDAPPLGGGPDAQASSTAAAETAAARALLRVHEVILEPGDLIFVPRGWPHQVENVQGPAVALSGNFIDRSNFEEACREAELLGLVSEDPRLFAGLLRADEASGALAALEAEAPREHPPLCDFKARHGERRTPGETQTLVMRIAAGAVLVTAVVGVALQRCWRSSLPAASSASS